MNNFPPKTRSNFHWFTILTAVLGGIVSTATAQIDAGINKSIWKMLYGATDAQVNSSTWLAADDDGDGASNQAELDAGTNPFKPNSALKVTTLTANTTTVSMTFPTMARKFYLVQTTTALSPANWHNVSPAVQVLGDGTAKTLSAPKSAGSFFRVLVQDLDSDNDGVSDWAELLAGLNPASATSNGVLDFNGLPITDKTQANAQLAAQGAVTVAAVNPTATQPATVSEPAPEVGKFRVSRSGFAQFLPAVTVNLSIGGTATSAADYAVLSTSVSFLAGETSKDILVTPLFNAARKNTVSVVATVQTSANYPIAGQGWATVIISPTSAPAGTGLLGRYYDTASSTYADAANLGQTGMYTFTRGTPTTTGTVVVTYPGSPIAGLIVGSQVKLTFTSGNNNVNSATFNNLNYAVTAVSGSTFTVSLTSASSFGGITATNGNVNFSIQSFTHPPVIERVDPTVNFDWLQGTPNGNVISPNNSPNSYSSTWECYLNPTTAGAYTFQLDADDKAEVLLDTGAGLVQIVEHNWNNPGADAVGTFKQSAPITLAVPANPAQRYRMVVRHVETTGDARCRLQWLVPGTTTYANIPQANQFTHTLAQTYAYSAGNAIILTAGGHNYSVGNIVPLSFSSGTLFTPGAASTYNNGSFTNGGYTITAVGGTAPQFTLANAVTTANSATITVSSTAGLAVGMAVTGTGLPGNEFITAIGSGTTFTVTTGSSVTAQAATTLTFTSTFTVAIPGSQVNIPGAATTAGSSTITVPSTAGLAVGMAVTGNGLPANEFITAIGTGTITVTTGTNVTAQPNTTLTAIIPGPPVNIPGAVTTAGNPTITVPSTAGLVVGMAVTGTGLPANEFITAIGTGTITVTTGTNVTAQPNTTLTAAITGFAVNIPGAVTTAGSPTITVPSTAGLAVGMAVIGNGLPANEFITAIGTGTITVTTGTGVTAQPNTTLTAAITGFPVNIPGAATTAGSPNIIVPSVAGLAVGMAVSGTGLPGNEFITAILAGTGTSPGMISVTTGTGVTTQASATLTATLPATGTTTGSGFVLNNTPAGVTGLYNLIYPNTTFTGSPGRVGIDAAVTTGNNGIWGSGTPDANLISPDTFTIRWTGQVQPQFTEDYTFTVVADDGCTLWINGQLQDLKFAVSNNTSGNTYIYNSVTGELFVNYAGTSAKPGSFVIGESARIDPTSGNLNHAPNVSPTYSYNGTTGLAVIDYSNLTTLAANSIVVGELVELKPTTGSLSPLANAAYAVTAKTATTFTVMIGTGTYATDTGNVTINDTRNAAITKLYASGSTYSYTSGTGATVITYSGMTGVAADSYTVGATVELAATSNALAVVKSASYVITAATSNTFTVTFPTGLSGTATGAVSIAAPPNGPISASTTNGFAVNIGANKYPDASTGNLSIELLNKSFKDWSSNGNERFVRLPMIGGTRYDIQLDYWESTSGAKCQLNWYSPSQTKQIIPTERLYPSSATQAGSNLISSSTASAVVNGAFSYALAGSNGGTVSISGQPAWLTLSNGVLSGTPPAGAAGDYQILITTTNANGTGTSALNLHIDQTSAAITREIWTGVTPSGVTAIPVGTPTNGTASLTSLQTPTNYGDNYGTRIRGYITAPVSGNYYFWLAASDAAELWISNDGEPVNKLKRASVTAGSATPLDWAAAAKTPWLALEAGRKYYIEILHKAGVGTGDNLAIGWQKPGQTGTTPSEVVSGAVLSPYFDTPALANPGTLFVATMLAQPGAVGNPLGSQVNGVGGAALRLSADETYATFRYTYSALTGIIVSQHIHIDPYLTHPSAIVYDIDQPETPGDGLQPDGSHKWTITDKATFTAAEIREALKQGKGYINLHTALNPNGEIRGNFTLAVGSRTFDPPPAPPSWTDDHATDAGAARFLTQATFGPNIADITALKSMASYEAWIDAQFAQPATPHLPEVRARELADVFGSFDTRLSFNSWWKNSMTAPDQLRQRVAFALSEIHVVSGQGPLEDNSLAMSHFYDTLLTNAFGNFRDVLIGTTLTPGMGRYLDMLRNDKPDLSIGRSPNENYAREIKQLFSIGLYRMWPDGSLILNSSDSPIDTYTQREIVGFAHAFTGWDYGYDGAYKTSFSATANWTRPMREVPVRHFTGPKRILNNEVLPGLATAMGQPLDPYANHSAAQITDPAYQALPAQELTATHDQLFNHPNTGPFICRQLIQRLVTSNPSRDYLYRVVQKFNDNGSGVRGDMKAVIKAILLDYEARSTDLYQDNIASGNKAKPAYGKQREPVLRIAAAARAFRPSNVSGTYSQTGGQTILITTSTPHLLTAGNSVFLEFTDTTADPAKPAPTTGTYTVLTTNSNPPAPSAPTANTYYIAAPGWMAGTYSQSGTTITVTMSGHWLPAGGKAYFQFTSGPAVGVANFDKSVLTVATSTAFDTPSGVGNNSGTTFTIINAPYSTTTSGQTVMISRFPGSYACTGPGGTITIDTANGGTGTYGVMADHHLSVGDSVFLNFTNSRDTTSSTPTSTENDLVYPIVSVPDDNTFTVTARSAANAAMNSDNQVVIFPQKAQPVVRSGSITTRASTFTLDTTDSDIGQTPLNSPTVFNFFLPDYKYPGSLASQGITTPEFQGTAETTVIRHANFILEGTLNPSSITGISSFKNGTNALVLDFSPWMATTAANLGLGVPTDATKPWTNNENISALIDQLSTLLVEGQLPAEAKTTIRNFVAQPISSISLSGTACTVTTVGNHRLVSGDSVVISGVNGGTFGGTANALNNTTTARTVTVPVGSTTTFTIPLACTVLPTSVSAAHVSVIPYNNATTTTTSAPDATQKRDRLRAIVHLILTSPDYTIQR